MRWRLVTVAFLLAGVSFGIGAFATTAHPNVTCNIPGTVVCLGSTDPQCEQFGANCDPVALVCVCASPDMGDLGTSDGFVATDLATPTSKGPTSATAPREGGGQLAPTRTGCSFVPGSAS
jgi:hypothetical protein